MLWLLNSAQFPPPGTYSLFTLLPHNFMQLGKQNDIPDMEYIGHVNHFSYIRVTEGQGESPRPCSKLPCIGKGRFALR